MPSLKLPEIKSITVVADAALDPISAPANAADASKPILLIIIFPKASPSGSPVNRR